MKNILCPICGLLKRDEEGKPIHPERDKEIDSEFLKIVSGKSTMRHIEISNTIDDTIKKN